MGFAVFEVLFVFVLLIINGIFSMSELSVVSARRIRLQQAAEKGSKGAQAAIELAESPNKFLSTVQIGITLIGILAGAFGGASIAAKLAIPLSVIPGIAAYSETISFAIVVGLITYFSIIIGELIPKSIALNSPERVASLVAQPMRVLSWVSSPLVWLLSAPTSFVLKLFRVHASVDPPVTDEEIKGLIDAGTKAGVFEETEQDLIESVIHLGDTSIASVMTPRRKIVWLDTQDSPEKIKAELISSRYSRLPIAEGGLDSILGYTSSKALLAHLLNKSEISITKTLKQPLYLPETITTLEALERFKVTNTHFAMVVDEFGGIEGLVTMHDVLEAIIGDLPNNQHPASDPGISLQPDGSWLMNGELSIIDFREALHLRELPPEEHDQYHTLAGFVITHFGVVPRVGDTFIWSNYKFEIAAMERNRVDKVIISPITEVREGES